MKGHILGFPRIGVGRELKKGLEAYWRGEISQAALEDVGRRLRQDHWSIQRQAGLSFVATGDFSFYDHILDISMMLGAVPGRFASLGGTAIETCFRMARGDAARNIAAMDMTKWFNTNYHYIVPELSPDQPLSLSWRGVVEDTRQAVALGHHPKPVLAGPITYLSLARGVDGLDCWSRLDDVLEVYGQVLAELDGLGEWIQLDEPVLCADMAPRAREAFTRAYQALGRRVSRSRLLLATYFEALDDNLDLALGSGCAGLHVDLTRGASALDAILDRLPPGVVLSAGIVDGRNIWRTDLDQAGRTLDRIGERIGSERLMVASSCSLLHSPVDLAREVSLDPELLSWMAFAVQKCEEIQALAQGAADGLRAASARAVRSRRDSPRVRREPVRERITRLSQAGPAMLSRKSPYPKRKPAQAWLNLPLLPTTTIGSFPQTPDIRRQRALLKSGEITVEAYEDFLRGEIGRIVREQEGLGLDVLVHGEPERNDMVEYFGQQLEGFCFTDNGWVQSYGSRCVKPPVIFGDVSRPGPMTVRWITHAQSLTDRPLKGMLTGPVTILTWSFVRDDLDRAEVCRQLGLAIRDEVMDLEAAGVRIVQIDEAALSEGMPIKRRDRDAYLGWAVQCFRLATAGVADSTQIHSHMCYSEFNDIIDSIAAMDADVISIESSRSGMALLDAFRAFSYPSEIGPGVYDIHSPRVPTVEEMVELLERALSCIPKERLWVNPDCGLKTRSWNEARQSLANMVEAARIMRERLA